MVEVLLLEILATTVSLSGDDRAFEDSYKVRYAIDGAQWLFGDTGSYDGQQRRRDIPLSRTHGATFAFSYVFSGNLKPT